MNNIQPTFEDYLNEYPKYKKFTNNIIAKEIFEMISSPDNIHRMLIASDSVKPALGVCIEEIERKYLNQAHFDLKDDFTRQALGSMVKVILLPFGYIPIKKKIVPQSKVLSTAAVYCLTESPTLKLKVTYVVEKV